MKRIALLLFVLLASLPARAGVPCSLPFNLTNGTTADATQVMANYNALVTCLGNAAAAGVNSDITALTALSTPISPAGGGSTLFIGGTSTGTANAQVVATPVPSGFSLTNGYQILFTAGFANTGATTLNVNGTGATAVVTQTPNAGQALVGGEIQANGLTLAVYSTVDSKFHLKSIDTQLGGVGPVTTIVSASTADLSLAFNHNASISGTTTIQSFGSNANVNFPLYHVAFTGSLTLTQNASSLILPGGVNIQTAAGDTGVATYLGSGNWQVISYQRANGTGPIAQTPLCGMSGLVVKNNVSTPATNVDVTANSASMLNGGSSIFRTAVSFTINLTTGTVTSTANGMDGEARPTSGWVYLYMIDNGTAAAGLGSLSSTSPTLPTGYLFSCYMGAMRADGSSNLLRTIQKGSTAQYQLQSSGNTNVLPEAGTTTSVTMAAISVTATVPATATAINLLVYNAATGVDAYVAPNTNYTTTVGTTLAPLSSEAAAGVHPIASGWMLLEGTSVFAATAAAGGTVHVDVVGWRDAVNAN